MPLPIGLPGQRGNGSALGTDRLGAAPTVSGGSRCARQATQTSCSSWRATSSDCGESSERLSRTLPWLGFVPDEVALAPRAAVTRLAEQLRVDPDVIRSYGVG